uniref:phragmoplast orienting kinesin-1 isoform X2 n=1 Tax=Fragaria vesca subsp. vesca TaxID=101020 RepID=UPI0005CA31C0|nr:PREDICTED: phragmoplast orienting kinesin-1 isoform X2 [Fragaria vesca subsp. vesca]
MPFISDTASALKSRFGFHDQSSDPVRSTPAADLHKSAAKASFSAVRSIGDWDDDDDGKSVSTATTSSGQRFEIREDPSFWKDHNVQVIIRVRPLNSNEISVQGYGKCVRQESCQTVTWTGHPESRFTFDIVADENVTQEQLFKVAGLPMVDNCMIGYNSCMFAYGQTGSGKTHTMLGDIEGGTRRHSVNCGMTPRVFEYLFSRIQKEKEAGKDEKLKFICKCSFLEIYNEQILDLLDPSSNNLQIREDIKKGVYVENLKEVEVTSARDVIQQLIQGAANRKVAATNMNRASSRSHSVFTCIIESKRECQGVTHHRFARLNLVDLAGSERQKSSGAEGERLKEATNINKSLSTLGLVIMNLVNMSNGKSLHVPYRDSKLTFLLQDSLGGNSKTIIIANISPSSCCSLETLSTLKFAQRAKFIKNNAVVNEDASGDVIAMRVQIHQLKKEVSRLRGLVGGGIENQDNETLAVSFPGSPGSFKWDGHGSFSPLAAAGKRISQKKDYEVALVGAFRREKDKDTALQASVSECQAAMQLAKQREDEIQGLKMRLRFREAGIKRLEVVASGKISAETHLLKEKEEHLKEIEVLRSQVDRSQEVTRFAMENLRLKEEIRRLKLFYEEGEREIMNEQIMVLQNKLLEALDWKLMHESDPSMIQNTNPDVGMEAQHDDDDDDFLNSKQEKALHWQSSINENEFLRMQAIQNKSEIDTLHRQLEVCLEEKENLERNVNDLMIRLEEETSRALKEKTNQFELPSLSSDVPVINFSDQMELKAMVDAIAAASQREAEAHETAITLSKENDELRKKLKVLIEDNNKLIELYEGATSEPSYINFNKSECTHVGTETHGNGGSVELAKATEIKKLEHQLVEMHEENEKLLGLYERAMKERDELKRAFSCGQKRVEDKELVSAEKLVEVDGGKHPSTRPTTVEGRSFKIEDGIPGSDGGESTQFEKPTCQGTLSIQESGLPGFAEDGHHASDEMKMCIEDGSGGSRFVVHDTKFNSGNDVSVGNKYDMEMETPCSPTVENTEAATYTERFIMHDAVVDLGNDVAAGTLSDMEMETPNFTTVNNTEVEVVTGTPSDMELETPCLKLSEDLNLVRKKLERADEQLVDSAKTVAAFSSVEKVILDVGTLERELHVLEVEIQVKQQQLESYKLLALKTRDKRTLIDKKLSALKYSMSNFSSSVLYFEQREARARAKVTASLSYLDQKKAVFSCLQMEKDEISAALRKMQESEVELKNVLSCLKSKLEEENKKQQTDQVLFAIDNVEQADTSQKNWQLGGKATELLKSEEEKTKLQTEMKLSREKLGALRKEIEELNMKSEKVESKMMAVQVEIQKGLRSVEETELHLHGVIREKEMLLEVRDNGKSEIKGLIVEYQQHWFESDLKEGEMEILEEELQIELEKMDELRLSRALAAEKTSQFLDTRSDSCFLSEKIEEELQSVREYVLEAKSLLGEENSTFS